MNHQSILNKFRAFLFCLGNVLLFILRIKCRPLRHFWITLSSHCSIKGQQFSTSSISQYGSPCETPHKKKKIKMKWVSIATKILETKFSSTVIFFIQLWNWISPTAPHTSQLLKEIQVSITNEHRYQLFYLHYFYLAESSF